MAAKILMTIWNGSGYEAVESEHEYTEFQVMVVKKADRPSWGGFGGPDEGVTLSLFEDEETGMLVRDVPKYEAWLATLQ